MGRCAILKKVWTLVAAALLVVALGVALAACGEEETSEEAKQQLVGDLETFKASFDGLKDLTASSSIDDVKAVREDVQAAWDQVVVSAADVREAEIGEVESAWDDLARAVDDISGDTPVSQILPSLIDELAALQSAYDELYDGLIE